MTGLFAAGGARVFTIQASADFAAETAHAMIEALGRDDPLALSEALILAPNRRAGAALGEAIAAAMGGAALLPTIRPLADLDDDPDVWGPDPIAFSAPPALAPMRRRFELAQLIRAKESSSGGVADPVRALAFADELARLLDGESIVDHVDWARLPSLVEAAHLAHHWQASATFLEIVTKYWPARLAQDGVMDSAARRSFILRALAQQWTNAPPATPVLIAGSTGSISATRTLMQVAASLPRGAVILPGLDVDCDDLAWHAIEPHHPQFHLKQTLAALRLDRADVGVLQREPESGPAHARRVFVREALAPADATADWRVRLAAAGGASLAQAAVSGVCLIEAESEDEEARAIAVMMREIAEDPARTTALVTPDAALARRVEAKLRRFGVAPLMTIAAPLDEAPIGRLLLLLGQALVDDGDPVMLAALAAHPLCRRFGDEGDWRAVERAGLRGARRHHRLADLVARLDGAPREAAAVFAHALAPISRLHDAGSCMAGAVVEALIAAAENLHGSDAVWAGDAGARAAETLMNWADHGDVLGAVTAGEAMRLLTLLLQTATAPPPREGDWRIAILGPLEARILRRDLVILGGLNEGRWPAPPPEDTFLSRGMRQTLGLTAPEARLGLAAHDVVQALNSPHVALTRSKRADGQPTVASRWVWRLRTLCAAADGGANFEADRAARILTLARTLDQPEARTPITPPQPRPPISARPRRFNFSEVETLIRDPYAVYARRVLGLCVLAPFGARAGFTERGNAIHQALQMFEAGNDLHGLVALVNGQLAASGFDAARIRVEAARLAPSLSAYVAFTADRTRAGVRAYFEKPGRWRSESGLELCGRADRIDIDSEGFGAVLDAKVGGVPTKDQVESGLTPQLTLEAAVLARGGFDGVPRAVPKTLIYIKIGGAAEDAIRVIGLDAGEGGEQALANLEGLLHAYANPERAYFSKPRVQFINQSRTDYDVLARRAEWADAEGEA